MRKRGLSEFGRKVNKRLVELNITQKQLAQMVGTSEAYLSMILHGERSGKKYRDKIEKLLRL